MEKLRSKLIIAVLILVISTLAMTGWVYGNINQNNVEIVNVDGEYLIYIRGNLENEFYFAFSNNPNSYTEQLRIAGTDGTNGNRVAYIDEAMLATGMFGGPLYLFVEMDGTYILQGVRIDLSRAIPSEKLEFASHITRNIPVTRGSLTLPIETIGQRRIAVTIGALSIQNEGQYEYQILKVAGNAERARLVSLANIISRFSTNDADIFARIEVYREFLELYEQILNGMSAEWSAVGHDGILQPLDSEHGEQYLVWIRAEDNSVADVQFMTATREYEEEILTERMTVRITSNRRRLYTTNNIRNVNPD